MSGEESDDLPSAQECQKRVEQFSEVTNTDEALAQFYLQDRQWNLEESIQAYFADNPSASSDGPPASKKAKTSSGDAAASSNQSKTGGKAAADSLTSFTFVTWNLDGLDEKNLNARTQSVIKTLTERDVDIIFLQEVVLQTYDAIQSAMGAKYLMTECKAEELDPREYFTVVLLKRSTVYRDSVQVVKFEGSAMMRDLTLVQAKINDKQLLLINSHLESTADFAEERMRQLRQAFDQMKGSKASQTVLFGGDLNMRDKEVEKVGGLPSGVQDLWIAMGRRKEVQYTWDMLRNQNKDIGGKFKPRMRFDRVYFKPSQKNDIKPEHFGLVGIEKVPGHQVFPSDHWGIFCIFKIS